MVYMKILMWTQFFISTTPAKMNIVYVYWVFSHFLVFSFSFSFSHSTFFIRNIKIIKYRINVKIRSHVQGTWFFCKETIQYELFVYIKIEFVSLLCVKHTIMIKIIGRNILILDSIIFRGVVSIYLTTHLIWLIFNHIQLYICYNL